MFGSKSSIGIKLKLPLAIMIGNVLHSKCMEKDFSETYNAFNLLSWQVYVLNSQERYYHIVPNET